MTTMLSPQDLGTCAIADAPLRSRVRVRGLVVHRGLEDRGCPVYFADITDGSGTVRLEFLGRRNVAGVGEGTQVDATGTIARVHGMLRILNPVIELHPPGC